MIPSPELLLNADRVRARIAAVQQPLVDAVACLPSEPVALASDSPEAYAPRGCSVGRAFGQSYASGMDHLLEELFAAALAASGASTTGIALAGVGSYGRGAMAFGADLDLRILSDDLDVAERVAEALLYPLWDAGMAVGHQVVTIADLLETAKDDLPTLTSLLDWRHIAGDETLCVRLRRDSREALFAPSKLAALIDRLEQNAQARHRRFGGSVYLLEPDVKNGLGALRDLDLAGWAARARWGVTDPHELVRYGVLVGRQVEAVERASEHLWQIRNLLHHAAGRRSDRLSFGRQETIAALLGYGDDLCQSVESVMSHYYRAARSIARFRELIMTQAIPILKRRRPAARDIGGGVVVFDGQVTLPSSERLQAQPAMALRLIDKAVDHGMPLTASIRNTLVGLCGDAAWAAALRVCPEAARLFVELTTRRTASNLKRPTVLQELHDIGILLAMIPEFLPVVGRVHHDTYHVYTVDVHSVRAVDRLIEIIVGEVVIDEQDSERWVGSLACSLGSEIPRPQVLFFATLLHDIGKSIGGRDHSERGAEMAQQILGRLADASRSDGRDPVFMPEDISDACRLIEHHLTMYLTATRRDIDDGATVEEFARLVGGRDGLRNLYLLTVADLSTTSPTSMTSWKAHMLDELYLATDNFFRSGGRQDAGLLTRRRDDAVHLLADAAGEDERPELEAFGARFIDAMPQRYALAHRADAIAAHGRRVYEHVQSGRTVSVSLAPSRHAEAAELCIVANDRLGLLQAIAAALSAHRLGVHGAQIYSCDLAADTRDLAMDTGGDEVLAVDLFWVRHNAEGFVGVQRALVGMRDDLEKLLAGDVTPVEVAQRHRPKQGYRGRRPAVASHVIIDNRASPRYTVVEVITGDRPGLLFSLAQAIYELDVSIAVAKIATEGTRVVDVFYVHEHGGGKLLEESRQTELKQALYALMTE
jgi:[protein-PII] uridylyltransferase